MKFSLLSWKGAGDLSAAAPARADLHRGADDSRPVAHRSQAHSVGLWLRLQNAGAIVADQHRHAVFVELKEDVNFTGVAVPHGIADRLLGDAVEVQRRDCIAHRHRFRTVAMAADAKHLSGVGREFAQRAHHSGDSITAGASPRASVRARAFACRMESAIFSARGASAADRPECRYCRSEQENLCDRARFTGYTIEGGYAEFTVADARFCFSLPGAFDDVACAPLLCAGLIGYRSLRKAGTARRIGIYRLAGAAHIVTQVARFEGREVFAFTRHGDTAAQAFARRLAAAWAGNSDDAPPELLDAAIIFAPVGALVPAALHAVRKGGSVVCGGFHMSDIPSFPYRDLWEERTLCSVANLTRRDRKEFLEMTPKIPVQTETVPFALEQANEALARLRSGQLTGAAVLLMNAASGA